MACVSIRHSRTYARAKIGAISSALEVARRSGYVSLEGSGNLTIRQMYRGTGGTISRKWVAQIYFPDLGGRSVVNCNDPHVLVQLEKHGVAGVG